MCYGSNAQGTLAIGNWHKVLLTLILLWATEAAVVNELPAKDCDEHCGNISIPYPFGIREGCYKNETFLITCNRTHNTPIAFLGKGNVRVTDIWLSGELRAYAFVAYDCHKAHKLWNKSHFEPFLQSRRFPVSSTRNKFTAIGCDTIAVIKGASGAIYTTGCISLCGRMEDVVEGSCSGIGCCQTAIPKGVMDFNISVTSYYNRTESKRKALDINPCSLAFVVEEGRYNFSLRDLQYSEKRNRTFPVVLNWVIGKQNCSEAEKVPNSYACKANSHCYDSDSGLGYLCKCNQGFQGNPYLPHGFQGYLISI